MHRYTRLVPRSLLGLFLFLGLSIGGFAHAMTVPAGFQVNTVVSGLKLPTGLAFAPDGRMFIAEKNGIVLEYKNGQLQSTPVIQLSDINTYGDRGLEGIAVDPNFTQNGFIYLAYTYENSPNNYSGPKTARIVRYHMTGDVADPASQVVILGTVGGDASNPSCQNFATTSDCIPSDSNTHSAGALRFGPDGKLYASLGDGAGYLTADPLALRSQDIHSLAGKIMRINTDGTAPSDNPYFDGNANDNQSKVWTLGNRNSYRFSFRPTDGKLFFGDVGWATWEEIDIGQKGANYGWPCREGYVATSYNCTPSSPWTDPIYVFDHHTGTASVIGGVFAESPAFQAPYAGNYIFGDYSNDLIKRMVLNPDDSVASVEDFVVGAGGPTDMVLGPDGSIYYTALNVGAIRNLVQSSANRPPNAVALANPTSGVAPLMVSFDGSQSSDPDGNPITFAWNFGDGQTGTGATASHTYANNGTYTATLTVTDSNGASSTATVNVSVGTQPQGDAQPHMVSTTISPTPVVIGHNETITTSVTNNGQNVPFVVDMEIYDGSGTRVAQQTYENASVPTGTTGAFSMTWLPPTVGTYSVKIGLFKAGWASLYEWDDQALSVTVANRAPSSTPTFNNVVSVSSATPKVGDTETFSLNVTDTGGDANTLVDLEVYSNGTMVTQQFWNNQAFAAGQTRNYTYSFPVYASGAYTVSVGVFQSDWASLYTWSDKIATYTAADGSAQTTIYQNGLAAGWADWSWGSSVNLSDSTNPAPGQTSAITVTYTQPWAGLFLHSDTAVSTAGDTTLTFNIAGNNGSGQNLQAYVYFADGTQSAVKNLSGYLTGGITQDSWKQVQIPLSDIGAVNKTITGIVLQDASGTSGASVRVGPLTLQ